MKTPHAQLIIAGDFNKLPMSTIYEQLNIRNTVAFQTRENAMLDYILTDIPEYDLSEELAPLANNDHCSILLRGVKIKTGKYTRFKKRKITKYTKQHVHQAVAEQNWDNVKNASSVHDKVDVLHLTVNEILDHHCPYISVKARKDRPPWMTSALMKTVSARDKARKKRSKSYKLLRAIVQRRIRSSKRAFIRERLNSNRNTKEWWDTIKSVTNKQKIPAKVDKHFIHGKLMSSTEVSHSLNEYYVGVGGEPIQTVSHPPAVEATLQHLSIGEVKLLMKQLDVTKSTSSDDFPTWVSYECLEDIALPFHDIVNCMIKTGQYPDRWKRAQVSPLPKVSTPTEYKHYRPISLLYHLGKISEQVIINKMRSTIDDVISPNQYAYKPGVSATDALLQYVDDITKMLDNPSVKYVQSACLDFSKAFDRLQPALVIDKMIGLGFNRNIVNLVSSFLSNRFQCVRFMDAFSSYLPISVGSPQGTKLGPLLWLIYVNDLDIGDASCIKYTDDTTFYKANTDTAQTNIIQSAIEGTFEWSGVNSMILNTDKTVLMNTNISNKISHDCDFLVNDVTLTPSLETKLLGVIVDNKFSFSNHADFLVSKCNSRLFLMRKLKTLGLDSHGLKTKSF